MPVISSATIKGTIVILSALSQSSPIGSIQGSDAVPAAGDTSSTPMPRRSEEHTSELQSLMRISYAVFSLTKKNSTPNTLTHIMHYVTKHKEHTNTINKYNAR